MSHDPDRTIPQRRPSAEQRNDRAPSDTSGTEHEKPADPNGTAVRAPIEAPAVGGTLVRAPEDVARIEEEARALAAEGVPGYVLLGELGRGGMGVVYKATQTGLGRTVALKMLIAGAYADRALRDRFLLEAESVAALEHPHIIRVFAFGEHDGHPYLAMEFVSGGSLSEQLKAHGPLPPRVAAERVIELAGAVAHAHSRGVVHRDIKPANVLLSADGELRLADFGLAKVGRSDLSVTGQVMGTPAYMAPEQAAGKIHEVGTAADVYALGAVLYDLLTGRPPFSGDSAVVTLQKVMTLEPNPPRALRADIPRDLETICLKCLEKIPGKRYATADALAADLRAFLDGRPITARPVSASERTWKWVKRNPGRTGAIAAAVLVLLGGIIAANEVRAQRRADRQAAEEETKQNQRKTQADDRVDALATADTVAVPRLIDELKEYRDLTAPRLQELARQPVTVKPGLHARLALLEHEPERTEALATYVPECRSDELRALRQSLKPHAATVAPALWTVLTDEKAEPGKRVRAACVLAGLTPDDARWGTVAPIVTELVVKENPLQAVVWAQALEPIRSVLLAPLIERYVTARRLLAGGKLDRSALVAEASAFDLTATLLAQYTPDRLAELVELAVTVDARHYALFREAIRANKAAAVPVLKAELGRPAFPGAVGSSEIGLALAAVAGVAPAVGLLNPDPLLDNRAKRQGYAAAALIALGEAESVWPLMVFPKNGDPGLRSYLIERLAVTGADPVALVRRFGAETDVSAKRALLIALGDFPADLIPPREHEPFVGRLLGLYRNDPDAGLHSAIDWLLRQKWSKAQELAAIDAELAAATYAQFLARGLAGAAPTRPVRDVVGPMLPAPRVPVDKDWYVNGEGQTFAVVRGPVEFSMGSAVTEAGRVLVNEPLHRKHIGRTFAIATKEVTIDQFLRFRSFYDWEKRHSPGPDTPVIAVTWYDCAMYCNWLSWREGIPSDQWCYLPNRAGAYDDGMAIRRGHLALTGYRLPTTSEWEYACRSGSATVRYFGRGEELLPRYARVFDNSENRAWPVGQLRPNERGLFDILGNAMEWVENPGIFYQATPNEDREDDDFLMISERMGRNLRGGAFEAQPPHLRSAFLSVTHPGDRILYIGFRTARTLPGGG